MSRLTVKFIGPVKRPGPSRTLELETDENQLRTVADLLRHLGYSDREIQSLHALGDGKRRSPDALLDGTRELEILVAIGGG
jgi:hypothetical protein